MERGLHLLQYMCLIFYAWDELVVSKDKGKELYPFVIARFSVGGLVAVNQLRQGKRFFSLAHAVSYN